MDEKMDPAERLKSAGRQARWPSWLTEHRWLFVTKWHVSAIMPVSPGGIASVPYLGRRDDAGWSVPEADTGPGPRIGPYFGVYSRFGSRKGIVYLLYEFEIVGAGEWELALGHDGGAKMFLDGNCVITESTPFHPLRPTRSSARVGLGLGRHEIVVALDLENNWGVFLHMRELNCPREYAEKPLVISDLGICMPRQAISSTQEHGHWKIIPYEATDFSGRCLWAITSTDAPELTLPLNVTGWHAVYLGLGRSGAGDSSIIRVKLSRDEAFQHRGGHYGDEDSDAYIEEVLFKCADLTGQNLHIAQQTAGAPRTANLYYIKLVPLDESDVLSLRDDVRQRQTKRLIGTIDGTSFLSQRMPTTKKELLEEFEPYRGTDFRTIWWAFGGADLVNYRSRLGTIMGENAKDFLRLEEIRFTQSVRTLLSRGIDITRTAVEACHNMGMDIHISMRPAAWKGPLSWEEFFSSNFYESHPEWRCRDRGGASVARMSFAVPEVRRHLLGIFREVLEALPDGLNMLYNRCVPVVLWEDAFCERFKSRYDEDARKVLEDDPRIYDLREEIMTEWMREVRQLLDGFQKERGLRRRLALSAMCLANEGDNRLGGLDVAQWVREGLIDQIGVFYGNSLLEIDMAYYRRVVGNTGIPVHPAFVAWALPNLNEMLRQSAKWYESGADGLLFWDPSVKTTDGLFWPVMSRLGHQDELNEISTVDGQYWPATVNLRTVDGITFRWTRRGGF